MYRIRLGAEMKNRTAVEGIRDQLYTLIDQSDWLIAEVSLDGLRWDLRQAIQLIAVAGWLRAGVSHRKRLGRRSQVYLPPD